MSSTRPTVWATLEAALYKRPMVVAYRVSETTLRVVRALILIKIRQFALPNLLWQAGNGWPVVTHMRELAETQLVNVERIGFLLEQLLIHECVARRSRAVEPGSDHSLLASVLRVLLVTGRNGHELGDDLGELRLEP